MADVQHAPDRSRFTADVAGGTAELEYIRKSNLVAFVHTFVPSASRGQGVGEALAEAAFAWAREEDLPVVVTCPFIKGYVAEHPEVQDQVR